MKRFRTTSKMSLLETQRRPTKKHAWSAMSVYSTHSSVVSDQLEAARHIFRAAADAFGTT